MNWWMEKWNHFEKKHPKLSKWIYQIAFFFVFSMGVTIVQYLFFTFMPGILGEKLAGTEFMWPQVPMKIAGVEFTWSLLGYNVLRDASGSVEDSDTLSAMKWAHLLHSVSIFRCREMLHLKATEILYIRQCGIL